MPISQYFLIHSVVDPKPDKILKILKDGYLFSSSYSGQQGISGIPLDYVHFTLLGKKSTFHGGINFILSTDILYRRTFRYALSWIGSKINYTTKINYRYDNVNKTLNKIDSYIYQQDNPKFEDTLHEILIKKKISLHRYLIAICCGQKLSNDAINYLRKYYSHVKILESFPNSANELNLMLRYYN